MSPPPDHRSSPAGPAGPAGPAAVALVAGEGDAQRAVARCLAARGVAVIVLGPEERAIAEIVGEIACGAGKARHVVGDPRDPAAVEAAASRARAVFGRLDATYGCAVPGVRVLALPADVAPEALGALAAAVFEGG